MDTAVKVTRRQRRVRTSSDTYGGRGTVRSTESCMRLQSQLAESSAAESVDTSDTYSTEHSHAAQQRSSLSPTSCVYSSNSSSSSNRQTSSSSNNLPTMYYVRLVPYRYLWYTATQSKEANHKPLLFTSEN